MTELTQEQRLAYARALKDNPLLAEILAAMTAATVEVFQKSSPDQAEERERAYFLSQGVQNLEERLNRVIVELTGETKGE